MHRLAAVPGDRMDAEAGAFVEQPPAPVVLLSSADTDLSAVATLLEQEPDALGFPLRALNLAVLAHPAVIDHYVASSLGSTRLVVVRLLGSRGHWSYGIERLRHWVGSGRERHLLLLAGTSGEEADLASLGSVDPLLAHALAACFREGGAANLRLVLQALGQLLRGEDPASPVPLPGADPLPHDWREELGPRVGLILYRALWQAGDLALVEACLGALRARGLCPRALWVSSLREEAVQRGVGDLLSREAVEAVLCTTGFASVQFEEAGLGAPLWEQLQVPVLQLLCSGRSRACWESSSIGLGPLDLSLQVALPELDGRLTTRVVAFKEVERSSEPLATALHRYVPDRERLDWVAQLAAAWISLRRTPACERRVALVLANYPTRNSRLANGVGLDTPASAALMLGWLAEAGYTLTASEGREAGPCLPGDGDALIRLLLAGRSNDPESGHRPPLAHLPLAVYQEWYEQLPAEGRERLEATWGAPVQDAGLEDTAAGRAFPIRGVGFGAVVVLIQPERGYDRDPGLHYHSPDLPPTHAYLAQYLWLRRVFAAQV
ncbi:MAG TPA: cobaltochelatase subunit CobN, partial [Cyanobium sp.]|nr:cobaltochelatase subunit CobN [Cyanobium sp.]